MTPAIWEGETAELVYPLQATNLEFEIEDDYLVEGRRIAFWRLPSQANWCFAVTGTTLHPHGSVDVCAPVRA